VLGSAVPVLKASAITSAYVLLVLKHFFVGLHLRQQCVYTRDVGTKIFGLESATLTNLDAQSRNALDPKLARSE
jgi:hypothetical protein